MNRFSGKSALITGAASGIGLATARRLADEGAAHLVLMDSDRPRLLTVMTQLGRDSLALDAISGDVADPQFWEAHQDRFATINYAVATTGTSSVTAIDRMEYDEWRQVMAINLDATFLTLQHGCRAMIARGQGGAIVVTGSVIGGKVLDGMAATGASKAAVAHIARIAAKEVARYNIRVNTIIPSGIMTPQWHDWDFFPDLIADTGSETAAFEKLGRMLPLGRFGTPGEIAGHILYLLSDDAAVVTGTNFLADSGYSL